MRGKPNILFLMLDSVRRSNMSCYGYERATTPNIDEFASEATLFEQVASGGCWTLPVHTSLFTGLYQLNHGMTISKSALPKDYPTVARLLHDAGYETCCVTNNAYISDATGLTQGFDVVREVWREWSARGTQRTPLGKLIFKLRKLGPVGEPLIKGVRLVRRLRKAAKKSVRRRDSGAALANAHILSWLSSQRNKDKPFFLFANYMECHEEYDPPHPYEARFMPEQYSRRRVKAVSPIKEEVLKAENRCKKDDLAIMTALYDGELAYLDMKIGELLKSVDDLGLKNETVIVIASDHGDCLGEHRLLGHRMALYEPLVSVPLLIRYPALFKSGSTNSALIQLSDLFPTFLSLAGVDPEKYAECDFRSLVGPRKSYSREYTVSENTAPISLDSVVSRTIRTRKYKLIWYSEGKPELFDLEVDPEERHNLFDREPEIAARMQKQLQEWQRKSKRNTLQIEEAVFGDALSERLRSLGYVNSFLFPCYQSETLMDALGMVLSTI